MDTITNSRSSGLGGAAPLTDYVPISRRRVQKESKNASAILKLWRQNLFVIRYNGKTGTMVTADLLILWGRAYEYFALDSVRGVRRRIDGYIRSRWAI